MQQKPLIQRAGMILIIIMITIIIMIMKHVASIIPVFKQTSFSATYLL